MAEVNQNADTAGRNTEQRMEDSEVIKQFLSLLNQLSMERQSRDFMEMFQYVTGMQMQMNAMAGELQGVREQLAQLRESQPKEVTEPFMEKTTQLQEKVTGLSERFSAAKDRLIDTAAQAVSSFKKKGKEMMCRVVQKGLSGVRSMLTDCKERMQETKADYEKTALRIDNIGEELKQIGNSVSNVGRLIAGKDMKEVSGEKPGVALTRIMSRPSKNAAARLQENMDAVDRTLKRLDALSERFAVEKEAEKSGHTEAVEEKPPQMKAEAGADENREKPRSSVTEKLAEKKTEAARRAANMEPRGKEHPVQMAL